MDGSICYASEPCCDADKEMPKLAGTPCTTLGGPCVEKDSTCDGVSGACHSKPVPAGTPCGRDLKGRCKGTQCDEPDDCAGDAFISLSNCKKACAKQKMCLCDLTNQASNDCWTGERVAAYAEKRGDDWARFEEAETCAVFCSCECDDDAIAGPDAATSLCVSTIASLITVATALTLI